MWQPETIPWDEYDRLIREKLKPARYTHSINVMNRAVELAETFGADPVRARLAGLLHDVMKNVPSKLLDFFRVFVNQLKNSLFYRIHYPHSFPLVVLQSISLKSSYQILSDPSTERRIFLFSIMFFF